MCVGPFSLTFRETMSHCSVRQNASRKITGQEPGHVTYLNWPNISGFLNYQLDMVGHTWVRKQKRNNVKHNTWQSCYSWPLDQQLHLYIVCSKWVCYTFIAPHLRYEGGVCSASAQSKYKPWRNEKNENKSLSSRWLKKWNMFCVFGRLFFVLMLLMSPKQFWAIRTLTQGIWECSVVPSTRTPGSETCGWFVVGDGGGSILSIVLFCPWKVWSGWDLGSWLVDRVM